MMFHSHEKLCACVHMITYVQCLSIYLPGKIHWSGMSHQVPQFYMAYCSYLQCQALHAPSALDPRWPEPRLKCFPGQRCRWKKSSAKWSKYVTHTWKIVVWYGFSMDFLWKWKQCIFSVALVKFQPIVFFCFRGFVWSVVVGGILMHFFEETIAERYWRRMTKKHCFCDGHSERNVLNPMRNHPINHVSLILHHPFDRGV